MDRVNKNLLITSSLIGSVDWYKTCPPNWKDKAEVDLHNTLARIWVEPDPKGPIRRGMDFEKKVQQVIESGKHPHDLECSDEFKQVLMECMGGRFQQKKKSIEEINGQSYCLFGKLDVEFPQKVLDLKTTGKPKEKHSYLRSFQHILYLYLTDKPLFEYLVVVFEDESAPKKITDICKYSYKNPGREHLQKLVHDRISWLYDFFAQYPEYWDLYITKYTQF